MAKRLPGQAALPGLVNTHSHAWHRIFRGRFDLKPHADRDALGTAGGFNNFGKDFFSGADDRAVEAAERDEARQLVQQRLEEARELAEEQRLEAEEERALVARGRGAISVCTIASFCL